ncbi:MAG: hypothetical protein J6S69_01895 [Proteobacteria bacterium]|nr:hypothetical protein [Pseudomonadota bacterium]
MKLHPCLMLLPAFLMAGCLYVAPIDEEPDPENEPPYINMLDGVSPVMGLVNIDLSFGGNQEFILSSYDDANHDQPLYHRVVIDYRPAGVLTNPVFAVVPKTITPGERDRISYAFNACTAALSYPNAIVDGQSIDMYLVLSDEPFMHQNQLFSAMNFTQPFETSSGRQAVWVQWTLQFNGTCPAR